MIKDREEEKWREKINTKPKLRTYKKLKTRLEREEYLREDDMRLRRRLTQLRGGTNELRIEEGRWKREKIEERICLFCGSGSVEDEMHFMVECEAYGELRAVLFNDIYMLTEGRYNMWLMVDDREWMLDALIGQGLSDKLEYWKAITTFIKKALELRNKLLKSAN